MTLSDFDRAQREADARLLAEPTEFVVGSVDDDDFALMTLTTGDHVRMEWFMWTQPLPEA